MFLAIFLTIFLLLIFLIVILGYFCFETKNDDLTIKYDLFFSMYLIDPEKWRLDSVYKNRVIYRSSIYNVTEHQHYYYGGTCFSFSFFDYIFKFSKLRKKLEKEKEQREDYERWSTLLSSFREDIDKYDKKHSKETKEMLNKILENRRKKL